MEAIVNWIKIVWKDPVWSKVISAGIIGIIIWLGKLFPILINILTYKIDLWLTLIFIIITFFVSKYYSNKRKKKIERDRKEESIIANNLAIEKEYNDRVWRAFNGLEEQNLKLLKAIYKMPFSDPDDKTSRMLSTSDFRIYATSIEKTNIPTGNRTYRPCITIDYIGDKAHLSFDKYFFELLENYSNTNEKTKL
ncbi:MAG: hypothetical protein K0S24_1959 [Sphingobacterium sp.]|jgi:ABC-type multidrug transport system fused ATPase/permease subunit|nr:hypothetical protein [Sphingobacterium sp.]